MQKLCDLPDKQSVLIKFKMIQYSVTFVYNTLFVTWL